MEENAPTVINASDYVINYHGVTISLEHLISVMMISTGTGSERFSTFVEKAIANRNAAESEAEQPQPAAE